MRLTRKPRFVSGICRLRCFRRLVMAVTAAALLAAMATVSPDGVSMAYVFGDTVDKAHRARSEGKGNAAVLAMGVDVLLWQSLASVAIPGLTINMVVSARQLRVPRRFVPLLATVDGACRRPCA